MRVTPSDQRRPQRAPVKRPCVTIATISSAPAPRSASHADTRVPPVSRMSSTSTTRRPTTPWSLEWLTPSGVGPPAPPPPPPPPPAPRGGGRRAPPPPRAGRGGGGGEGARGRERAERDGEEL